MNKQFFLQHYADVVLGAWVVVFVEGNGQGISF